MRHRDIVLIHSYIYICIVYGVYGKYLYMYIHSFNTIYISLSFGKSCERVLGK